MSHTVTQGEWKLMHRSFEGHRDWERQKQERLMRLILSIIKNDMDAVKKMIVDNNFVVDQALVEQDDGGSLTTSRILEQIDIPHSVTPLGIAAAHNQVGMLKLLLQEGQASPGMLFSKGKDAAWIAMEKGSWDAYLILMERGVSVDHRLPGVRETRLINAVKRSDLPTVRDLLARRSDVKFYDAEGRTALHHNFAISPYEDVDVQIGRLLIEYGGDPNAVDKKGIPAHAFVDGVEKEALLQKHRLTQIAEETLAEMEREAELEAQADEDFTPVRPEDPTDPGLPQLHKMQKKVKMKPLKMEDAQMPDIDVDMEMDSTPTPPSPSRNKHRL